MGKEELKCYNEQMHFYKKQLLLGLILLQMAAGFGLSNPGKSAYTSLVEFSMSITGDPDQVTPPEEEQEENQEDDETSSSGHGKGRESFMGIEWSPADSEAQTDTEPPTPTETEDPVDPEDSLEVTDTIETPTTPSEQNPAPTTSTSGTVENSSSSSNNDVGRNQDAILENTSSELTPEISPDPDLSEPSAPIELEVPSELTQSAQGESPVSEVSESILQEKAKEAFHFAEETSFSELVDVFIEIVKIPLKIVYNFFDLLFQSIFGLILLASYLQDYLQVNLFLL